jgi:hypothetical protein
MHVHGVNCYPIFMFFFSCFVFKLESGFQTCIEHTDDYIFAVLCFLEEAWLLWWLVVVKAKEVPAASRV